MGFRRSTLSYRLHGKSISSFGWLARACVGSRLVGVIEYAVGRREDGVAIRIFVCTPSVYFIAIVCHPFVIPALAYSGSVNPALVFTPSWSSIVGPRTALVAATNPSCMAGGTSMS
jgi:hypothetical protein